MNGWLADSHSDQQLDELPLKSFAKMGCDSRIALISARQSNQKLSGCISRSAQWSYAARG
jgi:hypothetical protein